MPIQTKPSIVFALAAVIAIAALLIPASQIASAGTAQLPGGPKHGGYKQGHQLSDVVDGVDAQDRSSVAARHSAEIARRSAWRT